MAVVSPAYRSSAGGEGWKRKVEGGAMLGRDDFAKSSKGKSIVRQRRKEQRNRWGGALRSCRERRKPSKSIGKGSMR